MPDFSNLEPADGRFPANGLPNFCFARCLMCRSHISLAVVFASLVLPTLDRAEAADAEPPAVQHPNIVVILADDLGYGDLSCYGATQVETPNLDRLCQQGTRFTDAHSPHSVCTPTRYALLTGRYAWRTWAKHRCVWSDDPLLIDPTRLTVPGLLKNAGYQTACIGKWHLGFGSPDNATWSDRSGPDYNESLKPGPLEVGFDYFFGIPHVGQHPHLFIKDHHVVGVSDAKPIEIILDPRTRGRQDFRQRFNITPWHEFSGGDSGLYRHEELATRLTREAVDWLDQQQERPFFLYFALRNVHSPLKPNARFAGTSKIGVYGDFIAELDWSVGELLKALDRNGLKETTLVLFSSDNGGVQMGHRPADVVNYNGHLANGPLRGQKTEVYEGGHRVPLIARWPGHILPGGESDALVALIDVLATFAELTGQKLPPGAGPDSFSFLPQLVDAAPTGPVRNHLVMDANDNTGFWAVREGNWKLILGQHGGGSIGPAGPVDLNSPPGQLYHLKTDISERGNVYANYPERVEQLTQLLRDLRKTDSTRELVERRR